MKLATSHPTLPYWRLSGFYFLFFITVGGFLPYWSLYLQSLGFDAHQIGVLTAILVVTKIFSAYIWGWVVDRTHQPVRVIRFTSLMSVITFSALVGVAEYWQLMLILFIFSFFWSASLPQVEAATMSRLGETTHIYTVIRVWGSIGFIIAVIILGRAFEAIPIDTLPIILLVVMLALWLLTLSIPEVRAQAGPNPHHTLLSVVKQPGVLALLAVCFLMQAGHGAYYTFFTIYLEANQYASRTIGILWAVGVGAEVLVFMIMHKLIRRFGLKTLISVSLLLAVIRWLMIAFFIEHSAILCIAQLLHAATFGVYHAVAIQYIHRAFKHRLQGRGQALYSSVSFGAGLAFGSYLSGRLWDLIGASMTFTFASMLSLLAFLIARYWLQNTPPTPQN